MNIELSKQIEDLIKSNDVVLFMKGNKDMPRCGFSNFVVNVLTELNITFKDIDVLQDPELREGIKQFSEWPTIPQLYIKGEFIGGCDITKEMFESGELLSLLKSKNLISA